MNHKKRQIVLRYTRKSSSISNIYKLPFFLILALLRYTQPNKEGMHSTALGH